jgi:hypothetical protein
MDKHYDSVLKENTILSDKINTHLFSVNQDKQDVDDEKSKYLKETILNMQFINNCLFGIYLILLIVLVYILNTKPLDIRAKIAIALVFLLYPFFISGLQDNLRFIYNFLFSASVYNNVSTVPESYELINDNTSNVYKSDDNKEVDYTSLVKENSILDTKNVNNTNDKLLNSRNSVFTADQSEQYKTLNGYLFILYYICSLGFVYVLFATTAFPFDIYIKMVMIVLLAGYPFYIDMLVIGLIYVFTVLYKLIMGQPYKDPDAKYDTVVY